MIADIKIPEKRISVFIAPNGNLIAEMFYAKPE
jgi:hypothetical protein